MARIEKGIGGRGEELTQQEFNDAGNRCFEYMKLGVSEEGAAICHCTTQSSRG